MTQPGGEPPNKGLKFPANPLTPGEVEELIAQCSRRAPTGIRNRAIVTMLYRSGLRIAEMLGNNSGIPALRPSSLNMDERSIRLLKTKSGKPQTRYWHASADDALLRWIETRQKLGLNKNGTPLFCTLEKDRSGHSVSAEYVRGMLRRMAAKAGIDKRVHPHGLRHTFAVEQRRAGTDIAVISKLLGHSSIAVTARYLYHLEPGEAGKALQASKLPPLGGSRPGAAAADDGELAGIREQIQALTARLDAQAAGTRRTRKGA